MEKPVFFLEIDLSHERITASALAHLISLGSYHIPVRQKFD